jgi:putative SOS response-associated peptidase YedK
VDRPEGGPTPGWFHRPDGGLILFAGLYEAWRPSPLEKERTFTIITTTPNALLQPVHNRMPVVLEDEAVDDLLYARQTPGSLMELLRPVRDDYLAGTPVSARVNSVKNDDPECLLTRSS